ncbi:MAG: EI24 domain-containing protein [Roseinatronobacter sp.]|nr:EI24 domain-containing protein [Roseinatronobacter sp.]
MIRAYINAVSQLRDPRYRRLLWLGVALALALLFVLYAFVLLLVQLLAPGALVLPITGQVQGLGSLFSLGSILYLLGLSVFLMVPVASVFTGLYLDDVADAVEAEHYPGLAARNRVPLREALKDGARYFGILVALNVLGMGVFALSNGYGIALLWLVNGFLLAREYFTMIARRRHGPAEARALQKRHMLWLWLPGSVLAAGLSVPVLNLAMPLVGAAMFTHLYHARGGAKGAAA